jgi:multisubunit Na+/H+ antiporter MnhG subunit
MTFSNKAIVLSLMLGILAALGISKVKEVYANNHRVWLKLR